MRRAAKVDARQQEFVKEFRTRGASVQPLHQLGAGVPDLLVAYRGQNRLVEIKSDKKVSHRRAKQLTPDQQAWWRTWNADVDVVERTEEIEPLLAKWRG